MHYLYKITNLINNKIYIGQTINFNLRWYSHKAKARTKPLQIVDKAIKKYGELNFSYELIESCDLFEDANLKEILYIKKYSSLISQHGYNIEIGGKLAPNRKGYTLTEDHKQKLSIANIGKKQSSETIEKVRKRHIGRKNSEESKKKMSLSKEGNLYNLGRKLTEEIKEKIRIANIGRTWSIIDGKKVLKDKDGNIIISKNRKKKPKIK